MNNSLGLNLTNKLKQSTTQKLKQNAVYTDFDFNSILYSKLMNVPSEVVLELKEKTLSFDNLNKCYISIGCGDGQIDSILVDKNDFFLGIDDSLNMLRECKKNFSAHQNKLILKSDVNSFFKMQKDSKFDVCLALGILPLFSKKKRNELLQYIHSSLKEDGLLIFYVEQENFRWFEFKPQKNENFSSQIVKDFFTDYNLFRAEKNIKPNTPFYDLNYWKQKAVELQDNKIFSLDKIQEIEWNNDKMTFKDLVDIFTGKEKVLRLVFRLDKDMRIKLFSKYRNFPEYENNVPIKMKFKRSFFVLKKY